LFMMIVPLTFFIISQSRVIETMSTSGIKDKKGGRMMETINKKIDFCGLLIMVLLFTSLQPTNVKASVPYESYTYNFWLDIVRSPHAYLPDEESTGSSMGTTDLNAPSDLFIADNGYMYIADTNNNRI